MIDFIWSRHTTFKIDEAGFDAKCTLDRIQKHELHNATWGRKSLKSTSSTAISSKMTFAEKIDFSLSNEFGMKI